MSSKDLKLVEYIDELIEAGVMGFKIEGRNKTAYYVATAARAYKKAVDLSLAGKYSNKVKEELSKELDNLTRRGYTTGFIFGNALKGETYPARSPIEGKKYLGFIEEEKEGLFKVSVKNKIEKGKEYELLTPKEISKFTVLELFDRKKELVDVVNPGRAEGEVTYIKADKPLAPTAFIRE